MSGWLVMAFPAGDPERVHVVPAVGEGDEAEPDPVHVPSPDCGCRPRITTEPDLSGERRQIVVHFGPN